MHGWVCSSFAPASLCRNATPHWASLRARQYAQLQPRELATVSSPLPARSSRLHIKGLPLLHLAATLPPAGNQGRPRAENNHAARPFRLPLSVGADGTVEDDRSAVLLPRRATNPYLYAPGSNNSAEPIPRVVCVPSALLDDSMPKLLYPDPNSSFCDASSIRRHIVHI